MNRTTLFAFTFAIATLSAGHAMAADPVGAKTREQVRAELIEAQRTGDFYPDGATNQKAYELFPQLYSNKSTVPAKTREQVYAEMVQAQRNGDIPAPDESGKKLNELYPQRYNSTH